MVRSLKSGLPLNDALRLIATEGQEPVKSEFRRVVESSSLASQFPKPAPGCTTTMPLQEVKFFGIVIAIQAQAGGNLSEALGNLSRGVARAEKNESEGAGALHGSQGLGGHHWLFAVRRREFWCR